MTHYRLLASLFSQQKALQTVSARGGKLTHLHSSWLHYPSNRWHCSQCGKVAAFDSKMTYLLYRWLHSLPNADDGPAVTLEEFKMAACGG